MNQSQPIRMKTTGHVLTIGEILVEIMATKRGQTFRAPGSFVGPFASGAPAIFIDQVARAGSLCALIGCVGNDDFGVLNIERLRRDGVDVSGIVVVEGVPTGSAFVTYRDDGERDFIFNIRASASGRLSLANLRRELLQDCAHFHVMGSSLFSPALVEVMRLAIETVKKQGGTVSFDPNVRKEMLGEPGMREAFDFVIDHTDIFLPSGSELGLFASDANEATAIAELLRRGVGEVIVKRGRHGCSYYDGCRELKVPAFAVEEVDPTGAGDCFGATYIACRLQQMDVAASLRYACASGAMAVTVFGPMEGTASLAELDALIAKVAGEAR